VYETALREVMEETGAELDGDQAAELVGMDVHGIPPKRDEPFHLHHDLIFGFHAMSESAVCSPESRALVWCGAFELDRYDLPWNVRMALTRLIGEGRHPGTGG
jgi:8-oxo-dGTP pyrophosphatase MutT (NUDIX family)